MLNGASNKQEWARVCVVGNFDEHRRNEGEQRSVLCVLLLTMMSNGRKEDRKASRCFSLLAASPAGLRNTPQIFCSFTYIRLPSATAHIPCTTSSPCALTTFVQPLIFKNAHPRGPHFGINKLF